MAHRITPPRPAKPKNKYSAFEKYLKNATYSFETFGRQSGKTQVQASLHAYWSLANSAAVERRADRIINIYGT